MKIIGTTETGFLIEAGRDEVFNFIGFYWHGSSGAPKVENGTIIKVHEMYEQLTELAKKREKLQEMASQLRNIADLLSIKDPTFNGLTPNLKDI